MRRGPPLPPRPELVRRAPRGFGWLDDRLLQEGWLSRLGAEPTAVLVLLALAADRRGVSFYRRDMMAMALSMSRVDLDRSLRRLLDLGLVDHRPWLPGHLDGVWQLLPVPPPPWKPRDPTSRNETRSTDIPSLAFPIVASRRDGDRQNLADSQSR